MKKKLFSTVKMSLLIMIFLAFNSIDSIEIGDRGYWIGEDTEDWHVTDWKLANLIVDFLKKDKAQSIVDFGCGEGNYVQHFLKNGFVSEGYDGNPDTPAITQGLCKVQDLSVPFDLKKTFDWVLSIEVAEHIPHQYEKIYVENLMRHANRGIILSWAVKGQGGTGHFNEQNNDYIKALFLSYGYENDIQAENQLRKSKLYCMWFKDTIMVFRKINN